MSLFWTGSIVLSYSDVNAAKQWLTSAFECKEVPVPADWDEPLPSDIALKFPGDDSPTVLLGSRSEGRESSEHPIIFTRNVKKAYEHLLGRGLTPGTVY